MTSTRSCCLATIRPHQVLDRAAALRRHWPMTEPNKAAYMMISRGIAARQITARNRPVWSSSGVQYVAHVTCSSHPHRSCQMKDGALPDEGQRPVRLGVSSASVGKSKAAVWHGQAILWPLSRPLANVAGICSIGDKCTQ